MLYCQSILMKKRPSLIAPVENVDKGYRKTVKTLTKEKKRTHWQCGSVRAVPFHTVPNLKTH